MLCGNPNMNHDMTQYLEQQGWTMTTFRGVGNFTVEKAFVLQHD
jgi:ferredoxin--NADP+ reductase